MSVCEKDGSKWCAVWVNGEKDGEGIRKKKILVWSQPNISLQENTAFEYAIIVAIVVPIIFGIIVLVGLFGNTLVVIVIIANKQMRSTTNYLIFRWVPEFC